MSNILTKYRIDPKEYKRESLCKAHGEYVESGFSLSGLEANTRWLGCAKCNKAQQEMEVAQHHVQENSIRQRRIDHRLDMVGIPLAYRGCTFNNFETESEEMNRALTVARSYADNFQSKHLARGTGLVFGGGVGTGKSHLAAAVAREVMATCTYAYTDAMSLIRGVRSTWKRDSPLSEENILRTLGHDIDLLIIDEVGVQRGTEDEQTILFDILNRRYGNLLPTILVTNVSAKALNEFLGPRTWDRLYERSEFVRFGWNSWRSKLRQKPERA